MISSITNTIYNGFVNIFVTDQQEKQEQILEPLTCIIKLGILYLKEDGTKLQIIGNSIHYYSPSVLQGTNRWIRGDNRNDLHNLSNPIKIALEWYTPSETTDISNLLSYAVKGLSKLGESYNIDNVSSLIGNTISHYINLITMALNKKPIELKDELKDDRNNSNVYKDIWTSDEIAIINKLFEIAITKKKENDSYEHYIKSIQSILNDKDEKIREIVHMKTTKIQQ
tara:strand:- start:392 stop:1069 length:678 start_codon:yes stop_codon:yes gene_type:complete